MSDESSIRPTPTPRSRPDDLPAVGDGPRPALKGSVPPPLRATEQPVDLVTPLAVGVPTSTVDGTRPEPPGRRRRLGRVAVVTSVILVAAIVAAVIVRSATGGPHVVRSLRVGGHPIGITSDGTSVWVVGDEDGGPVRRIDPDRVVVTGSESVGRAPYGITATSDAIWVANGLGNSLTRIPTDGVTQEFPLDGVPYDVVAVSPSSRRVFVSLGSGSVYPVDETGSVDTDFALEGAARGLASDGSSVWVAVAAEGSGPLGPGEAEAVRIDVDRGTIVGSVPLTGTPDDVAIGHGFVWVTDVTGGSVFQIDPDDMSVVRTIDVGAGPQGIVAPPSGVWVTVAGSDEVVRIDPESGEVTDRVPTRREPMGIVAVGDDLWIADHSDGTVELLST